MNDLILKKIQWQCFDQPWIDLDLFKYIILEEYEASNSIRGIPSFQDIRESHWIAEEMMYPIVSYYTFNDEHCWHVMEPGNDHERFYDVFEDTFSEVEDDIFGMLYEHHLFFHHYEDQYIHMPIVQVW